ncbi:hypothetical protein MMC34_001520 [Xylographa carneopallida]|nr:hypothetical protein [Xylographa carneopallida]
MLDQHVNNEKDEGCGDCCSNPKPEKPRGRSPNAREGAKLEAIGCVCKALLALGAGTCCTKSSALSLKSKESNASIRSLTGLTRSSTDSHCRAIRKLPQPCCRPERDEDCDVYKRESSDPVASGSCAKRPDAIDTQQYRPAQDDSFYPSHKTKSESLKLECCTRESNRPYGTEKLSIIDLEKTNSASCAKVADIYRRPADCLEVEAAEMMKPSCCAKDVQTTRPLKVSDDKSSGKTCKINQDVTVDTVENSIPCCLPNTHTTPSKTVVTTLSAKGSLPRSGNDDLEKGKINLEHVVLSIRGMTCTGCEKKLLKSVNSLQLVQNITTSLSMEQVQFDLDVSRSTLTVDEIVTSIEKMTGFACIRISRSGHNLDVLVKGSVQDFVGRGCPFGVASVAAIDKSTVRLTYNPSIVGARDLLSQISATLAPPQSHSKTSADTANFRKMLFTTVLSAILTIPVLILAWAPLPENPVVYGSVSLALATIIQITVAGPFYPNAFKALIYARMVEMDLLIVLSTSAAYVYSVIAFVYEVLHRPLATGEFFETSTLLVTLIMVGRTVSTFARRKALDTISVESLSVSKALLFHPESNTTEDIDARLLQYGDRFKVLPDMKVVTDGVVKSGETEIDESMITGEAVPVSKTKGSTVVAGSLNSFGTVIVKLTRLPGENFISDISDMLDGAKFIKPKVQETTNRVASYFTPFILIITLAVFVIWIAIGVAIRYESAATAATAAMTYAISALIVSCPCAIGLAVPMVVVIASGVAAKHGVILKSSAAIESARKVTHVVFDKTGTLTQGNFSVVREVYFAGGDTLPGSLALGLMSNSKHPIALAITAHFKQKGFTATTVEDTVSLVGKGVKGTWTQRIVRAGNPQWLNLEDLPVVQSLFSSGLTILCLCLDNDPLAIFGLEDSLRPDATQVITRLQQRKINVSLLSGDNSAAVHSLALKLGLPDSHVRAQCSPDDKQHYIRTLLDSSQNTVLFCGDGTNDAVALAQATIGVHVNEGTDVASGAADAILLRPALSGILVLMDLSAAFHRRVCFNFLWAFVYNVFAILLAAGAFVNARIPPQYAGLGELVSVLPVVAIAMQLRWSKFK